MSLIIEVSLNGTKTIACYAVRRVSHTNALTPHGETCNYEVRNAVNTPAGFRVTKEEPLCHIKHNYDDPVEKIVELAMKKIQEGRK